ncbi:MAG: transposase, partial [Huintestinicola sp.]
EKYVKAVPLYRLEKDLAYSGINISRQTMDNLVMAAAEMMIPLYELMHKMGAGMSAQYEL